MVDHVSWWLSIELLGEGSTIYLQRNLWIPMGHCAVLSCVSMEQRYWRGDNNTNGATCSPGVRLNEGTTARTNRVSTTNFGLILFLSLIISNMIFLEFSKIFSSLRRRFYEVVPSSTILNRYSKNTRYVQDTSLYGIVLQDTATPSADYALARRVRNYVHSLRVLAAESSLKYQHTDPREKRGRRDSSSFCLVTSTCNTSFASS